MDLSIQIAILFFGWNFSFVIGVEVLNLSLCRMMTVVTEKGVRHQETVKEKKTVQESMRKKLVMSHILRKTTSMSELEGVKLLIATVLQKEYFPTSYFSQSVFL